jgi:hypothetical protein
VREIVKQTQGHSIIQELCKKILTLEAEKASVNIDDNRKLMTMTKKVQELEASNKQLQEINALEADLTVEYGNKLDHALNEVKQLTSVEISLKKERDDCTKTLEKTKVEMATLEEQNASLQRRKVELEGKLKMLERKKGGKLDKNENNMIQELESSKNEVRTLNDKLKEIEKQSNTNLTEKMKITKNFTELLTASQKTSDENSQLKEDVDRLNSEKENISKKFREVEDARQELEDINTSIKKANTDLTIESREKLEIALREVKKAYEVEKALKLDKRESNTSLDHSKQEINDLGSKLQFLTKANTDQAQHIKDLEVKLKNQADVGKNKPGGKRKVNNYKKTNLALSKKIAELEDFNKSQQENVALVRKENEELLRNQNSFLPPGLFLPTSA